MGKKLLPPYGGSNRKKMQYLRSQKNNTQMQHLNESQKIIYLFCKKYILFFIYKFSLTLHAE